MIDFYNLAKVGDEYYLTKACGGLTLVEIVSKTDSHIYAKFIIDNKVKRISIESFNRRFAGQSATYKDIYDTMADNNNKYLTNANVLRNYYNKRDYININRHP